MSDRSPWEDGRWPFLPFPGPPASGFPTPPTPSSLEDPCGWPWSPSLCPGSLLLQNCPPCFPRPTWLHILWLLPVHTTHSMSPTHPALGTPGPCQPGFAAQGSLGCQFKGFCFAARCPQECFSGSSSCCRVRFPTMSPLQLQPPCGARAAGLLRMGGGGSSPLGLSSPYYVSFQPHAPGVC